MHVRIGSNVWKVSSGDFKKFGHDSYALRVRSKSARIIFTKYGDDWFRTTNFPKYDSTTLVTSTKDKTIISKAFPLSTD